GSYSCNLTGLKGSTKYYVKAFAVNEIGISYSDEWSFTTGVSPVSVPSVTTPGPAFVSLSAASLSGRIDKTGDEDILLRGVVWGKNADEILTTSSSTKMYDNTNVAGEVTYRISGLEPAT